ncbi:MAG: hypothetical protein JW913_07980 [Chitinispirillaceae bacterium]|nr:hypothetical protein [Chitinispirillaceae bacterium]
MNKYTLLIVMAIITVLAAGSLAVRVFMQRNHFNRTVKEALKTSEGYDQKFIDMVDNLENELALRASFGFSGRKDPMTGKERIVVRNPSPLRRPGKAKAPAAAPSPAAAIDSVKLTAIIFDDEKKLYTAIVMVGERSFAIEVGDYVVGRKITTINNERVIMEDDLSFYSYDITGNKGKRDKLGAAVGTTSGRMR